MVALIYVDDLLAFGHYQDNIDEVIKELDNAGLLFTVEYYMYAFLLVEFNTDKKSVKFTLTQGGLTNKVLNTVVMLDSNNNTTLAATMALGTDADVPPCDEPWGYYSVVGVLVYLSRNSSPDIQFSVHQCARFAQNTRKCHSESINRIYHYLFGTQG